MKKYITFMMAALLVCAMMIQMLPLALPVSAEAGTEDYELSNEVPAGLEFTTAASFSKVDNSVRLTCKNNIAWYNYGNYSVFLDPYGNIINGEKLSLVAYVFGELQVAKPVNSSLYAIYYKGVRISQPIYIDCFEQGDCVIAEKEGGRDFYAPDGSRRIPGALPTEYEARSVTSAGTVIARKYNPDIIYSDGTKAYDYALFDQNGRKLFSSAFTGTDESETLYLINDHMISMHGGAKFDNYGVPYGKGSEYVIGGETVFITAAAEENQHEIYDLNHNRLGSIEATGFFRELGDAIIYQLNGRFGLMDKNGNVLVEPTYQWAVNANVNDSYYISYQMPALKAVAFERLDYQYDLYNGKGELLGVFADAPIVYPNCIVVNRSDGTPNVYDLNGQLTMDCAQGQSFKTVNGVCFLCDGSSNLYYVVDLYGNRLSEEGYTTISEDLADVYGLVHVKRGNAWYTVNAVGTVQNENGMDAKVDLSNPWTKALKPEELLGVYSINGKNGICRYIPPINACEKTEDGKHEWKISEVLKEATCTETGEAVFKCSYCQRTRKESIPIDPENHAWSFTEALTEGDSLHDREGLYTCIRCGATEEDVLCAGKVFTDMPAEGNWAHDPIDWAYFHGVTSGKTPTTFAPKDSVTRAEAMTFLWKTMGSPEPNAEDNPFTDVPAEKYFYKPVLWAVENGVTSGATETSFAPKNKCTRAQIMMFLWAAAGRPEPETGENPFADVSEGKYYYSAVLWAVEHGITGGVAPDKFGPNNTCTRAQIVAFLYKAKDLMHQEPAPQPDPGFVEWRWFPNNTVMDRNDLGIGSVEHIWITVRGDQVPELRTDNAEVAQLHFWGIVETPNGFPEDCFLYDCEVTVIGEGTAQIRCFLGDNMVGELTIDCEHLAFRDAYWFGDDGLAVEEEEITLEDGEEAHLGVVMHYSQVISGEAGMDPTAWEQPTIYTDAPERLSLVLTETKPPYYVTRYDRGFLWHGTVSGAGPIHVYIELNGEIVKTLTVQVP